MKVLLSQGCKVTGQTKALRSFPINALAFLLQLSNACCRAEGGMDDGKGLILFHDSRIEPRLHFRYPAQAEPEDPAIIARGTGSSSGFQKGRRVEKSHERKLLSRIAEKTHGLASPRPPYLKISPRSQTRSASAREAGQECSPPPLMEAVFVTVGSLLTNRLSGLFLIRR
jgi:hypothetical protein